MMSTTTSRREFLRRLQLSAAAAPFLCNLPSFASAAPGPTKRKQRLIIVFSPNGVVPKNFWPDEVGEKFQLKPIMEPLAPFQDRLLTLHGVNDKIRGDGDNHMRGIGCLLTGIELLPGNIQGGSDTPAGWSSGHSIDQEIKTYLQKHEATRTRFGSLEFGVAVPDRADTWTRMVYAGPNKPIAPVDDPYQMFHKLYGRMKDQETLKSVLDELQEDLKKVRAVVGAEDRRVLDEHANFVRETELELKNTKTDVGHAVPELVPGVKEENDNIPQLSKMQIELLVGSLAADFTRIATLQYDRSVGGTKMKWLGIDEGHHSLSHEPDSNEAAQTKLTKINRWYAEQIAYLAKRLQETPEPDGSGNLLDNTTIIWTNELGKGNSHTLNDIPFVLVGGGLPNFQMGRSLKMKGVAHNRLLMALAHGFGHEITRFGNADHCQDGPLMLT
jgi:hypothetical protein